MTWTATEYELAPGWPIRTMYIRDQDGQVFCELNARADDEAALEQMRARARLIVQAEAMLEALKWAMKQDRMTYAHRIEGQNEEWCDGIDRARAIIKETEK